MVSLNIKREVYNVYFVYIFKYCLWNLQYCFVVINNYVGVFFFFYMFVGIDKKINKWKLNYFYVNDFVIFY